MKKIITLVALIMLATACGSKASSTSTSTSSSTGSSSGSSTTITPVQISEWGVEFTPIKSISDVRYAIEPNHMDTADFTTASLVSLDQQSGGSMCAVSDAPLGKISRVVDFNAFTAAGHSVPPNVKIGDYYYYYTQQQGSCSTVLAVQNLQSLQSADFDSIAVSSLKAIPSK
jgi:hypothetical protein